MRTDYSTVAGKPRQSLQILSMIAAHGDSDECLIWPYKCNDSNYGMVRNEDKKDWLVTRLTFKLLRPDEFNAALLVLHSCDNPPCFNPRHLFQGTQADNMKDMDKKGRRKSNGRPGVLRGPNPLLQGERCGNSKLTEADVLEIRRRHAECETQTALAAEFGLTQGNVGHIVNRRIWRHI